VDLQRISAGELDPVYVITSDHPILVDRAVAALRDAAVPPAMRAWNYDVIEGKATASRITAAANTLPMMGARRMVLVRDLAAMVAEELSRLTDYLESPSPTTVLVALSSKVDKRMKIYAAASKKKWLHVLEAPRQVAPWIRAEAQARGVKIAGDAVGRLADAVGADLSRLALVLDQLALYAGDLPISVDDVDDLVADTRERTVFELTDAIGEGRLTDALAAVSALCDQRASGVGVVVMLARHVRQMALIHGGKAADLGKAELAAKVGAPPFVVERLTAQARRYHPHGLVEAAALLGAADAALKGLPLDASRGVTVEGVTGTALKTLGRQLGERVILERLVTRLVELAFR
jgi:DNA polymerase-3 subunit delta